MTHDAITIINISESAEKTVTNNFQSPLMNTNFSSLQFCSDNGLYIIIFIQLHLGISISQKINNSPIAEVKAAILSFTEEFESATGTVDGIGTSPLMI